MRLRFVVVARELLLKKKRKRRQCQTKAVEKERAYPGPSAEMSEGTTTLLTEGGQQFFEHFYSYMDTGRWSLKVSGRHECRNPSACVCTGRHMTVRADNPA